MVYACGEDRGLGGCARGWVRPLLMGSETTADPVHAYALALIAESLDTDGAADRIELLSYRLTKAQAEDAHRLLDPGFFTTRH